MTALLTDRDAVDVVEPAPHGARLDRDRCAPDEARGVPGRHHGPRT
ncbi:hypothetical protein [Cellulosimicrobium funkei]